MSVGAVNKNTGDRIPTAGNPLDKVGNLASLHTTAKNDAVSAINEVTDEQAQIAGELSELNSNFISLGLSVVNGKLCQTYSV